MSGKRDVFPKQCPLCGGNIVVEQRELWEKEGRLAVTAVETVGVCQQCGEYWLSPQTVERLEHLREKLRKGDLEGLRFIEEVRVFTPA